MSVHHLIYVSRARRAFTATDLEAIVAESRAYNPRQGITGILLYAGSEEDSGSFMQLLEGPEAEVERLRDRIFADRRHHTKVVLSSGDKAERDFSEWSMAFRRADPEALRRHPGFTELGTPSFLADAAEGRVTGSLQFLVDFWNAKRQLTRRRSATA